jgi:SAM-dependent methyltransferase
VVLSDSQAAEARIPAALREASAREVVWHELECGSYRADLALWRELAERHPGPVLDVGAGAGRVALELARAGHEVTALDLNPLLLEALGERAGGLPVETVKADARALDLDRRDFALCLVPMQTLQLMGGEQGRGAFLRGARAHLRPDGLLACAILSTLEPFYCAEGDAGPPADRVAIDGLLYVSRATRVREEHGRVLIERERRIVVDREAHATSSGVQPFRERDVIELDVLEQGTLEREAIAAGLRPEAACEVAPTDDHVGSIVVMLRA